MPINQFSLSAPFWVQDHDGVRRLLHKFIDQLDKGQQTKVFAKPNSIPELFDFDNNADALWSVIDEKLHIEHGVISIDLKRKLASTDQKYLNARLTFSQDKEPLVRAWLGRPALVPYHQQWQTALAEHSNDLSNPQAFSSPIKSNDLTAAQILAGFVNAESELAATKSSQQKISLRTLSARCFLGDSKFLDQRRQFVEHALPLAKEVLQPRAIMMSVYLPKTLQMALFIENFDTFRSTVRAVEKSRYSDQVAVIYSAGYRSSAAMIRDPGHSQFVTINHATETEYSAFTDWWFSARQDVPVLFWGDLDFEGMGILKSLRAKFENAMAFQAAYQAVLEHHQHGVCHAQTNAHKGQQVDPVSTGCSYADTVLLPAIRSAKAFTDQEVLCEHDIAMALTHELNKTITR